jgi:hypothetical protein
MERRPKKDPASIRARAEALEWADRVNQMEGLPAPTEEQKKYDAAVIAGDMTPAEAVAAILADYKKMAD